MDDEVRRLVAVMLETSRAISRDADKLYDQCEAKRAQADALENAAYDLEETIWE